MMRRLFCSGAFALAAIHAVSATAANVDDIAAMLKGGAVRLALQTLDARQTPTLAPPDWADYERQRLAALRVQRDWPALVKRVESLPDTTPPEFRREALKTGAEAQLDAGEPAAARRWLRELLWSGATSETAAYARRLVIRSYIQEKQFDDAQTALLRYLQDYPSGDDAWRLLQAEVSIQQGDAAAAAQTLTGLQSYDAQLLRLLASLHGELQPAHDILTQADALASKLAARPAQQRAALTLAAQAAQRAGDLTAQVAALERALSLPLPTAYPMTNATADDLWRAYDQLADKVGNAAYLLVGNDGGWFDQAQAFVSTQPSRARALFAFISQRASDEGVRSAAAREFTTSLARNGLSATLDALYMSSARFPDTASVPRAARYVLAERAVAAFDIRLAAELVRDLDQAPDAETPEDWALRRARIFTYAGDIEAASAQLDALLRTKRLAPALTGRLLQVLFDMQAADHNEEALVLLQRVYDLGKGNARLQRELLFWMADAEAALKRHARAADLYLQSAAFAGANADDPWGQSARFQAAAALAQANLMDDARTVYMKLLDVTADPRRRAQIEHEVQQLWLKQKSASTR